ncbi:hypothetical protein BJ973_009447 [Actinoplanes tereljensis]|uniref:hypothetical protein n=1 Tax=Paractinoplanes tereljensis TaxID=571912 RepID=UPI001943EDBB|nr:hypothetical protein [Actinoplanes tereljensis]
MTDAEFLIDLSAPRHYEQVTPRGRRRRRVAMAALAGVAMVIAGGAGYAAIHRTADPATAPAVSPSTRPTAEPGALPAPRNRPVPGLDPIKASPAR